METASPACVGEITVEQRILSELRDLKGRINKLKSFLESPAMADVNGTQEFLMNIQLEHMIDYDKVLSLRLRDIRDNTPKASTTA